ncbi:heat repeat domain containing protein [Stylonychia lemnae]|uniref:Heat repeat domain containing protein n=1 Tax=Stylonychia lemnae TaxID=5949 RepID=A0A078A5L4_STYLE|nr:heat repeat domain containing protein [Stylonychia lemnae]|eukprot:CDW77530.1 heat repeat domain containing protein [Stylonychia lemnae]
MIQPDQSTTKRNQTPRKSNISQYNFYTPLDEEYEELKERQRREQLWREEEQKELEEIKSKQYRKSLRDTQDVKTVMDDFKELKLRSDFDYSKVDLFNQEQIGQEIDSLKKPNADEITSSTKIQYLRKILNSGANIFKDLTDNQKFRLKDLSQHILLSKDFKPLQSEALSFIILQALSYQQDIQSILHYVADLIDTFTENLDQIQIELAQVQKVSIKSLSEIVQRKVLYQSSHRIFIQTYILLTIVQSMIIKQDFDNALDHMAETCNGLAHKLISNVIQQEKDQNSQALLLNMVIQDLIDICYHECVEFPVGTLILKSIVLQLIQYIQMEGSNSIQNMKGEDEQIDNFKQNPADLNHKLIFADMLTLIMTKAQDIIMQSSKSTNLCYCDTKILEGDTDENYTIKCEHCQVIYHYKQLRDILQALKNTMLCMSYFRQATIRAKAIKAIKSIIKINPENLLDANVQQIILLRLKDQSANTRETTLDLVSQYIQKFVVKNQAQNEQVELEFQKKFVGTYLPIIIERADDSSICVRKKVVQILAYVLQQNKHKQSQMSIDSSQIIRVLIQKWEESNDQIKETISKAFRKLIKVQTNKKGSQAKGISQLICGIIQGLIQKYDKINKNVVKALTQIIEQTIGSDSDMKNMTILDQYGLELVDISINLLIVQEQNSQVHQSQLIFIEIISRLRPALLVKRISLLNNMSDQVSDFGTKAKFISVVNRIFTFMNNNKDEGWEDQISFKVINSIFQSTLKLVNQEPINALESISYLWLQYPELIMDHEMFQNYERVYEVIYKMLQNQNINEMTLVRMIETQVKFMEDYDERLITANQTDLSSIFSKLQKQVLRLAELYQPKQFPDIFHSKSSNLRYSLSKLIEKLFQLNVLHMIETCPYFLLMLNDTSPRINEIAIVNLEIIANKRYEVIVSCFQPNLIIERAYDMQSLLVGKNKEMISVFQKYKDQNNDRLLIDNNSSVYDEILKVLSHQNDSVIDTIVKNILLYLDNREFEGKNKDAIFEMIKLACEILITALKHSVDLDSTIAIVQDYVSNKEVIYYKKIKESLTLQIKNFQLSDYINGYVLVALKSSVNLMLKIKQISKKQSQEVLDRKFDDFQIKDKKQISNGLMQKILKEQNQVIDHISEYHLQVEQNQLNSQRYYDQLSILKDGLKSLIREKENQFKLKIEKRLYGKIRQIDNDVKEKRRANIKSMHANQPYNKKRKLNEINNNGLEDLSDSKEVVDASYQDLQRVKRRKVLATEKVKQRRLTRKNGSSVSDQSESDYAD